MVSAVVRKPAVPAASPSRSAPLGVADIRVARHQLAELRLGHVQRVQQVELASLVSAAAVLLAQLSTATSVSVELHLVRVA